MPGKKACFDFVTSSVIKNTLVSEDFLDVSLHERAMKHEYELLLASRLSHAGGNQEKPLGPGYISKTAGQQNQG